MASCLTSEQVQALEEQFGRRLKKHVPLGRYAASRIGGPAEFLVSVRSSEDLEEAVKFLWSRDIEFRLIGGGTNILIADEGIRGVVLLNRARSFTFEDEGDGNWILWAESGASMGTVARRSVERSLTGLEWAAAVPGSVGGAVVNNAGAMGGETASSLAMAEILQPDKDLEMWQAEQFEYEYRNSVLKANPGTAVVLRAAYRLKESDPDTVQGNMNNAVEQRRKTQPTGASWGSMFKNPPGNYAGRLIEEAGLKGLKQGGVEVSTLHANFFLNQEEASAADVARLIHKVREAVREQSGIELELEVELFGEWPAEPGIDTAEGR